MKEQIDTLKEEYKEKINIYEDYLARIEGKDVPKYMYVSGQQKQLESIVKDLDKITNG